MKTKHLISIAAIVVGFLFSHQAKAQNEFRISMYKSDDGYHLTCESGCNWKTLDWKSENKPIVISKAGIGKKKRNADGFAFVLNETKTGFEFYTVKGTSWENLSYSCSNKNCAMILTEKSVYGQ